MVQVIGVPHFEVENEMFDGVRRGVQGTHRIVERIVPILALDLLDFFPVQFDRDFQRPKALHVLKIRVFIVGCVASTHVNLAGASGNLRKYAQKMLQKER
jgi:hypothetical protein